MNFDWQGRAEEAEFEEVPAGGTVDREEREDFEEGLSPEDAVKGAFGSEGVSVEEVDEGGKGSDPFTNPEIDPDRKIPTEEEEGGEEDEGPQEPTEDKGGKKGKEEPQYGNASIRKVCYAMAYTSVAKYSLGMRQFALYAKGYEMEREEIKKEFSLDKETFDQMVEAQARVFEVEGKWKTSDPRSELSWMMWTVFGFMGLQLLPSFGGRAWYDTKRMMEWIKTGRRSKPFDRPPSMSEGPDEPGQDPYAGMRPSEGPGEDPYAGMRPAEPYSMPEDEGRQENPEDFEDGPAGTVKKKEKKAKTGRPKGNRKNPITGRFEYPIKETSDGEFVHSWNLKDRQIKGHLSNMKPDDPRYEYLRQYEYPVVQGLVEIWKNPAMKASERKDKLKEKQKELDPFK